MWGLVAPHITHLTNQNIGSMATTTKKTATKPAVKRTKHDKKTY